MPPTKTIAIRVPNEVLDRLREAAAKRGVTVTDLLLAPWRQGEPTSRPIVNMLEPKDGRQMVAKELKSGRLTMNDVRGDFKPRLKPDKGTKR